MVDASKAVFLNAELVLLRVADGGEGTTDFIVAATKGQRFTQEATGPLEEPVEAFLGLLGDGQQLSLKLLQLQV